MFSGFMTTAWEAATVVAIVAGIVGFFTVLRGSAFAAHALPNGAFAGAAGAALLGITPLIGLAAFSITGALAIAALGKRAHHDVATALVIVAMLGLGSLFLSLTNDYAPAIFALLFGQVLGVSASDVLPTMALAALCIGAILLLFRPLTLASILPDIAEARGLRPQRLEIAFLLVLALVTTMAVPVVGALLIFTLLVSPAAAARCFTARPGRAICLSVAIALATVWGALALSFISDLPVGFFVGVFGAGAYVVGRGWAAARGRRRAPATR